MKIISEPEFRNQLIATLTPLHGKFRSVTGPGRSGCIAAVYASHMLGIPFVPISYFPTDRLRPLLLVDTAAKSGSTLRKYSRRLQADEALALYSEPPRVRFWYEQAAMVDRPMIYGAAK